MASAIDILRKSIADVNDFLDDKPNSRQKFKSVEEAQHWLTSFHLTSVISDSPIDVLGAKFAEAGVIWGNDGDNVIEATLVDADDLPLDDLESGKAKIFGARGVTGIDKSETFTDIDPDKLANYRRENPTPAVEALRAWLQSKSLNTAFEYKTNSGQYITAYVSHCAVIVDDDNGLSSIGIEVPVNMPGIRLTAKSLLDGTANYTLDEFFKVAKSTVPTEPSSNDLMAALIDQNSRILELIEKNNAPASINVTTPTPIVNVTTPQVSVNVPKQTAPIINIAPTPVNVTMPEYPTLPTVVKELGVAAKEETVVQKSKEELQPSLVGEVAAKVIAAKAAQALQPSNIEVFFERDKKGIITDVIKKADGVTTKFSVLFNRNKKGAITEVIKKSDNIVTKYKAEYADGKLSHVVRVQDK